VASIKIGTQKDKKEKKGSGGLTLTRKSSGSGSSKKKTGGKHGKLPEKRSINLIIEDSSKIHAKTAIPLIIIIVVLAVLFSKFLVIDRLVAMSNAAGKVAQLQTDLQSAYDAAASFGELEDKYAHYTWSGMNDEEKARVDRVRVMKVVEEILTTGDTSKNWTVTGNVLTVQVTGGSLQEMNKLAQKLEKNKYVDRCVITTANKGENLEKLKDVSATFIVYLQQPDEDAAATETEAENTEGEDKPFGSAVTEFLGGDASQTEEAVGEVQQ
jgi:hypothetical protein